ncbi:hypothetical protein EFR00_19195 [Rhizobium sophoriradicis]|nr:hypothetical protein EFR00_19195 [Rhizobium sophoriradicis]
MRRWRGTGRSRPLPFSPQAGRRCRQADEGPMSASTERWISGLRAQLSTRSSPGESSEKAGMSTSNSSPSSVSI